MSKKKKEDKRVEGIMLIDNTKILRDLSISASFVGLIQNALIYIMSPMEAPEIIASYQNIDSVVSGEDKNRILTEGETHIYTLTTLVQYLRSEAEKQKAVIPHESLTPQDLEPALKAFAKEDFDTVKKELEWMMKKVKPSTVS